jgi:hypothetical protein
MAKSGCRYDIDDQLYDPVVYGGEAGAEKREEPPRRCPDCGAGTGEVHRDCCEVEECPRHRPQPLVSCDHYTYVVRVPQQQAGPSS